MIIDNNYDYQEWYLHDLNATQTTQENKLSQKNTAAENKTSAEKQSRTDIVDFGTDARNVVDAGRGNGVAESNKAEQNDLAHSATTQDNRLSKGTASSQNGDGEPIKAESKPELRLRLHTANMDRYEGAGASEKQRGETEKSQEADDGGQKITAAQQKSIAAYQQQQSYTNSLVMSQNLAAHLS